MNESDYAPQEIPLIDDSIEEIEIGELSLILGGTPGQLTIGDTSTMTWMPGGLYCFEY